EAVHREDIPWNVVPRARRLQHGGVGGRDRAERRRARAVRPRQGDVRYGEVVDHPPLVPAALVIDYEQRIDVGEDIDEGVRIVGIGGQARLRLEDETDRADRRLSTITPGD